MNKRILIVAAHPDDEVLGCGGTIARHSVCGDVVNVVFMTDGVTARTGKKIHESIQERTDASLESCMVLGAEDPIFLGLPDNRMDTVALLDIVQLLEKVINDIVPSVIYTHHANDLNVDHRLTHQSVMTACRPQPSCFVEEIYSFEIPSSTEWGTPSVMNAFVPNYFINIEKTWDKKIAALQKYQKEMREFPHARSLQGVESLARYRGSSVGLSIVEAFMLNRFVIKG